MAPKPTEEQTRLDLDDRDAKDLLHDFVYRPDMSVKDIAEHLGRDWEDTYQWLNDQLEQAKDDDE